MIDCLPLTASPCNLLPHISVQLMGIYSNHTQEFKLMDECRLSSWCASLPIDFVQINHPQVHLHVCFFKASVDHPQSHWIIALKCIGVFTWIWPPSAFPNLLDRSLQGNLYVHSSTTSKSAWSRAQGRYPTSLNPDLEMHHQTHSITISKCNSELTWLGPLSVHDQSIQVHRQSHIMASSKCPSIVTWSWPPSATLCSPNDGVHVHLCTWLNLASRFISMFSWWPSPLAPAIVVEYCLQLDQVYGYI